MKNLKAYFHTIIYVTLLLITSCNIEPYEGEIPENIDPDGNTEDVVFKVDFDEKTFVADTPIATILDNVINISGLKTDTNEIITLTIFGSSEGTYQFGVTENVAEANGAAYNTNFTGTGDTWIAVTDFVTSQGEITITDIDDVNKTISGTFFFTGHNPDEPSKAFTNGIFTNISFADSLVSGDSENTFFAKIDGEEFIEDAISGMAVSLSGTTTININATKNSIETIGLTFDIDITPGDYSFGDLSTPLAYYNPSFTESFTGEGTFTIISHDKANKRIIGSFAFTGTSFVVGSDETREITEGSFDVTYL